MHRSHIHIERITAGGRFPARLLIIQRQLYRFDGGITNLNIIDFKRTVIGEHANQAFCGILAVCHRPHVFAIKINRQVFTLHFKAHPVPGAVCSVFLTQQNRRFLLYRAGNTATGTGCYFHLRAGRGILHIQTTTIPVSGTVVATQQEDLLIPGGTVLTGPYTGFNKVIAGIRHTGHGRVCQQKDFATLSAGGITQYVVAVIIQNIEYTLRPVTALNIGKQIKVLRRAVSEIITEVQIRLVVTTEYLR